MTPMTLPWLFVAEIRGRTGGFCNSAMEALSRDPDIVAISHEATYIREHLPFGLGSGIATEEQQM